jgi:protein phosphatase PTC1
MSDVDPSSPDPPMNTKRPGPGGLFTEGPNARSKSVTVADGHDTFGVSPPLSHKQSTNVQALNCHPSSPAGKSGTPADNLAFRVGVSEDKNKRCRRTMEDSHSFVYDYCGVRGQGYFAVFEYVSCNCLMLLLIV